MNERTEIDMASRMAAVFFHGVDVDYWYTDHGFVAGEQLHHADPSWVGTAVQEALAVTAR